MLPTSVTSKLKSAAVKRAFKENNVAFAYLFGSQVTNNVNKNSDLDFQIDRETSLVMRCCDFMEKHFIKD